MPFLALVSVMLLPEKESRWLTKQLVPQEAKSRTLNLADDSSFIGPLKPLIAVSVFIKYAKSIDRWTIYKLTEILD